MKIRSKQSPIITDIFLSSLFFNGGLLLVLLTICFLVINFIRTGSSSQLVSVLFCLIFLSLGLLLTYQGIKIKHQIYTFRIYVKALECDCHLAAIAHAAGQTDKTVKENLLHFIAIGYLPFAELNKTSLTFKTASSKELPYDASHAVSSSGYTKKVRKSGLCAGCHAHLSHSQPSVIKKEDKMQEAIPEKAVQDSNAILLNDDHIAKVTPSNDDAITICIFCGTKSLS